MSQLDLSIYFNHYSILLVFVYVYNNYWKKFHNFGEAVSWYHIHAYLYSCWYVYHVIITIYDVHNSVYMQHIQNMNMVHNIYTCITHVYHSHSPFSMNGYKTYHVSSYTHIESTPRGGE